MAAASATSTPPIPRLDHRRHHRSARRPPLLGIKNGLLLGAAIDIVAGILLLARDRTASRPAWLNPVALSVVSLAAFGLVSVYVHPDSLKMASGIYRFGQFVPKQTASLVMEKHGKTATVHLLSEYGILTLRTNGKTDASLQTGEGNPTSDEYTQMLTGVLGLYHRPQSEYVANIGIGSGMTTHSVLSSPRVKEVHTIEIERYMLDGARLFGKASERTFNDPRSRFSSTTRRAFSPSVRGVTTSLFPSRPTPGSAAWPACSRRSSMPA
jgi:hypothetical protein